MLPGHLWLSCWAIFLLGSSVSCLISPLRHSQRLLQPVASLSKQWLRTDLLDQCTEKWRNATLDHFSYAAAGTSAASTFRQRYFVCDKYWQPAADGAPGPIFFYLGNEANVLLYLNNTGLMWETAPAMGALLVFAEHRFYGESLPFGKDYRKHLRYLSAEQALADFAELITELKSDFKAESSAVIGFGGSYGGMLAAWARLKYPHLLDGAIAASAPIWVFEGEDPAPDPDFFAKVVTYDTTEAAGSAKHCRGNVRRGWQVIEELGGSAEGRAKLHSAARLCPAVKLKGWDEVWALREWLAASWDFMAMGNFPYPSGYMLNGNGQLPAYPVRAACQHLTAANPSPIELIAGLAQAAGVFYNYSGDVGCFDFREGVNPETTDDGDLWGWQACTEMLMPFGRDGETDMFWPAPWNTSAAVAGCLQQWGVSPRRLQANIEWGGRRIQSTSNIVFSNGLLDPWSAGGVLHDISDTLLAVIIPEGAHHLDLMFSNPQDPPSVTHARDFERKQIRRWIQQVKEEREIVAVSIAAREADGLLARGSLQKRGDLNPSRQASQARQI